jgi:hypothetical protein
MNRNDTGPVDPDHIIRMPRQENTPVPHNHPCTWIQFEFRPAHELAGTQEFNTTAAGKKFEIAAEGKPGMQARRVHQVKKSSKEC